MNTQTNTSAKITNPLHIVAGLTYTAGLARDNATKVLLMNAARMIAQTASTGAAQAAPKGHKLSDKAVRLLEHCLGMYDPDEADCPHFDGMTPPTAEEAYALLTALQTSDVRFIPDPLAHSVSVADASDMIGMEEPESVPEADAPQQPSVLPFTTSGNITPATRRISTEEFFRSVNGGALSAQDTGGGAIEGTPNGVADALGIGQGIDPERRAQLRSFAEELIRSKGPLPSNPEERKQLAISLGSEALREALANPPAGVSPEIVKSELREWHDHLGMHIKKGDIPAGQVGDVTDFHAFVGSILDNVA